MQEGSLPTFMVVMAAAAMLIAVVVGVAMISVVMLLPTK